MKDTINSLSLERCYLNVNTGKKGKSILEVYSGNIISELGLKFFLDFGYIPGKQTLFEGIERYYECSSFRIVEDLLKDRLSNISENFNTNVLNGGQLFNKTIESLFQNNHTPIILPITSGLDSRMILGGLLECTDAKNITSFTWAPPGSFDFEVSKSICSKFGIKHYPMDITKYKLTEKRLMDYAERTDCSVSLFDHWPVEWIKDIVDKTGGTLWMGLLGGTLSGSNLPMSFAEDPLSQFLQKENRSGNLSSLSGVLMGDVPNLRDLKKFTEDFQRVDFDTLDIYLHHLNLIVPTKIHDDFNYVLPFAQPELMQFFLSLPIEHRIFRLISKEIIVQFYPQLARFPTHRAGGFGLHVKGRKRIWLNRLRKRIPFFNLSYTKNKYLPLRLALEHETLDRELLMEKFNNIKKRELFHNKTHVLDMIWNEFFGIGKKNIDHSKVLDKLISLEIILDLVDYPLDHTTCIKE